MAVEVRQLTPPADVRGLVEHPEQGHRETATGGCRGNLLRGFDDGHRQRRHEGAGGAAALLGQRVERAAAAHERGGVELGAEVRLVDRVHPRRHLTVREARRHLLRRTVDAATLLLRGGDDAAHLVGGEPVAVPVQDRHRLIFRRPRQPGVDVGDRTTIERGGEEKPREEILSRGVEVGIRLGPGVA